jgi:hypothetical protein
MACRTRQPRRPLKTGPPAARLRVRVHRLRAQIQQAVTAIGGARRTVVLGMPAIRPRPGALVVHPPPPRPAGRCHLRRRGSRHERAGGPRRWRALIDGVPGLVLRSFSARGAGQCFAAFLTFLPLCLTFPASFLVLPLTAFASCFAFLATPMTDSSSSLKTPQSGGCHLPRWVRLKPGVAASVPPRDDLPTHWRNSYDALRAPSDNGTLRQGLPSVGDLPAVVRFGRGATARVSIQACRAALLVIASRDCRHSGVSGEGVRRSVRKRRTSASRLSRNAVAAVRASAWCSRRGHGAPATVRRGRRCGSGPWWSGTTP